MNQMAGLQGAGPELSCGHTRRSFLAALASFATSPSLAQARVPIIGYLSTGNAAGSAKEIEALLQGLSSERLWVDKSFVLEKRFGNSDRNALAVLAKQLVDIAPAVIIAGGRPAAEALRDVKSQVPILYFIGNDPVALGMAASLARPGGYMTGYANMNASLNTKRFELLLELVPNLRKVGWLVQPENPFSSQSNMQDVFAISGKLGLETSIIKVQRAVDFLPALRGARTAGVEAIVVANDSLFIFENEALVSACRSLALPAIASFAMFPQSGGLASYGPPYGEGQRQLGGYAARILRGASPADLPILQPQTFDFVVNASAARQLNLAVSDGVMARASEVLE